MPELFLPQRILVDQDGVLANFEAGFLKMWQERFPDRPFIPLDQRRTFYIRDDYPQVYRADVEAIYTTPGFIQDLDPIPGSLEALKDMQNAGHIVRICTSPLTSYRNCVEEKFAWVEKHLGFEWTKNIILAKDKTEIVGDLLIDDRPEQTGSLPPTWKYVLFDQPYNRNVTKYSRLTSWENWPALLH